MEIDLLNLMFSKETDQSMKKHSKHQQKERYQQIGSHQHTDGIRTRVQFPATAFLRYNFHSHKNIDHNT